MRNNNAIIGILAVASIIGIAAVAFAHGGYGRHMGWYGGHMMGQGYGYGHMMDGGPGYGPHMRGYRGGWQDLSDKEAAKVDAERTRFFEQTRELRNKIDEKQAAMRSEMVKENPDQTTVLTLQKELSELNAEFDQKALSHRLEMRKLLPEKFEDRGFWHRGQMGPGYCW